MALAKDTGFLLRKIHFSESSLILKVYTREHGLLTLMAKGAKQPKSRTRGMLEPILHLQFLFPAFSRSEIRILGEVSLLRDFPAVREDIARQGLACVFAEILLRYTPSESDAPQFHDLLLAAQEKLESSTLDRNDLQAQLSAFILGYCTISGFQPQFRDCVKCGDPVSGANIPFMMDRGGPLCANCQKEEKATQFLREGVLRWLDAIQSGNEIPELSRTDAWRAEDFLLHYLGRHTGGEKNLKSLAIWHEMLEVA